MINYIVQVLLFQTVFMAVYDLVLKKETFFQWNRAYLIVTSVLAYVIPLIRFTGVSENIPQEYRIILPEVMLSPETFIEKQIESPAVLFTGLQWMMIVGAGIAAILFLYKIFKISQLIKTHDKEKRAEYDLVLLPEHHSSFSFFHYIFIGNVISGKDQIIKHELVHVKEKHSIDLLFFELQKILLWFNPYSYLYQKRIAEVHEFIADSKTVSKKEKSTFYNSLLAETFSVDKLAFVNSFNKQSIIKKRIIMFSKEKSREILKLKYLWLIPVLIGMVVYTSCENTESDSVLSKSNEKRFIKFITEGYTKTDGTFCEKEVIQTEIEGYFDLYNGLNPGGKEISVSDLTDIEKEEYLKNILFHEDKTDENLKIIEFKNGNRMIQQAIDVGKRKRNMDSKDYSNADIVPFAYIDQVPVYPGCEDAKDQKGCMVKKITEHVNSNFNTSLSKNLGLEPGKKRVYVQFEIDKTGKIVNVRARGPHEALEKEAIRVVSSLPAMQPGENNGKKVSVKYTLPITLVVSDEQKTSNNNLKLDNNNKQTTKLTEVLSKYDTSKKEGSIYGVVSNNSKLLPGVNINVKGTNRKTITDYNGSFKINATKGETLVFQFNNLTSVELFVGSDNFYEVHM